MTVTEYLVGLASFVGIFGSAYVVASRAIGTAGDYSRSEYNLAVALTALAFLTLLHLIPGVLGVLSREAVLILALLSAGYALLRTPRVRVPLYSLPRHLTFPEGVGVASIVVAVAGLLAVKALRAPDFPDTVAVFLPTAGRWIQDGSVWSVIEYLPSFTTGTYPQGGNMSLLWVLLPWNSDWLIRFSQVPYFVIAGTALNLTAQRLGAPRPAALLTACAALTMPWLLVPAVAFEMVDLFLLATFVTGWHFLLRHVQTNQRRDLVLGGVGLGLAFGAKWYGVTSVPVAAATWAGLRVARGHAWRSVVPHAQLLSVLICGLGGIWLLRNLAKAGNPFFPNEVSVFGLEMFRGAHLPIQDVFGARIIDFVFDPAEWAEYLGPQLLRGLGPFAIWVICASVAVGLTLRKSTPFRKELLVVAAGGVALLFMYALTPFSAYGAPGPTGRADVTSRYAMPGLLVLAPVAATLGRGSSTRLRLTCWVLAGAGLAGVAISPPIITRYSVGSHTGVFAGALVAMVALGWAVSRAWHPLAGRLQRFQMSRESLAVATISLIAVSFLFQREYESRRYRDFDPAVQAASFAKARPHIAITGLYEDALPMPVWSLFGRRIENSVRFVGSRYEQVLFPDLTREQLLEGLLRHRSDLLLDGRAGRPGRPSQYERWAVDAGWRVQVETRSYALLVAPSD